MIKQNVPINVSPFFGIAKSNLPSKESTSERQVSVLAIKHHGLQTYS